MLHIVNGEVVGGKLKEAGVEGDILVWREIYTHGPVFVEMEDTRNRELRAAYLENTLAIPREDYIRFSEQQEKRADEESGEIVLWFEHDLFDQTMLCWLLRRLHARRHTAALAAQRSIRLVCIGEFPGKPAFKGLGELTPAQLAGLFGSRQLVNEEMLRLGSKLWEAYSSPNPEALVYMLDEDLSALPFADNAFRAHLARMPAPRSGLGSIERATLEEAARGNGQLVPMFQKVSNRLSLLGLGDLEYWHWLSGMAVGSLPLIEPEGENFLRLPGYGGSASNLEGMAVRLTSFGQDVLAGRADWQEVKEREEWLGGMLIRPGCPWRWDAEKGAVVRTGEDGSLPL